MTIFVWMFGAFFGMTIYIMCECIQAGCPLQAWQNAFWLVILGVMSIVIGAISESV